MDKSKLSNEEVFKLETNEIAEQMGCQKPFDENGNPVVTEEKKTSRRKKSEETEEGGE